MKLFNKNPSCTNEILFLPQSTCIIAVHGSMSHEKSLGTKKGGLSNTAVQYIYLSDYPIHKLAAPKMIRTDKTGFDQWRSDG